MNETDVKDKRGNVVISPGLKVRHKGSQYEYTVDHVEGEGEGSCGGAEGGTSQASQGP